MDHPNRSHIRDVGAPDRWPRRCSGASAHVTAQGHLLTRAFIAAQLPQDFILSFPNMLNIRGGYTHAVQLLRRQVTPRR